MAIKNPLLENNFSIFLFIRKINIISSEIGKKHPRKSAGGRFFLE